MFRKRKEHIMSNAQSVLALDPRRLYIGENVRRDPGDLSELVASLGIFGLLQPVTVEPFEHKAIERVIDYTQGKEGSSLNGAYVDREVTYTHRVVYGQRRTLAAIQAGLTSIPCIVRQIDAEERTAAQLVENLHREGLSLGDTAEAVRDLYDEHGSVSLVAEMLGKGAPWVSKMLALTSEGTGKVARALMAEDALSDLDMAYTLTRIEKIAGVDEAKAIAAGVRDRTQNRATLRQTLADLEGEGEGGAKVEAKVAPKPAKVTLTANEVSLIVDALLRMKDVPAATHLATRLDAIPM